MSKTFQDLLKYTKEQLFVSIECAKKQDEFIKSVDPRVPLKKLENLGISCYSDNLSIYLAPHEFYQKINRHITSLHEEKDSDLIELLKEYKDKKFNNQRLLQEYYSKNGKNNLTNLHHYIDEEPYFSQIVKLSDYVFLTTFYDTKNLQNSEMYCGFYVPKSVAFRFTDYLRYTNNTNNTNYVICEDTITKFSEEDLEKVINTCENNWNELHVVLRDILRYETDTKIFDIKVSHRKYVATAESYQNFPYQLYKNYKHLFFNQDPLVFVFLSYGLESQKRDLYNLVLDFFKNM
jgi:hypothetical protein